MYRIVFPGNRLNFAVLIANLLLTIWSGSIVSSNGGESRSLDTSDSCSLDAVVLTTGKDSIAFEKSIQSSLLHFLDVRDYYIVTPKPEELIFKFKSKPWFSSRIKIVGEDIFPFKWNNISEIMIQSVADKGIYPLDGNSVFEKTVYGRIGWFLQQLLKLYAGKVLGLNDFILLDSDVVWFNDIRFTASCNETSRSYYYASSCQYHPPYMASLGPISGVNPVESKVHRSGIVHHMVIVKSVLDDLMSASEKLNGGRPFWQVLLNVSAIGMTCRAPKTNICGAGSTLSEYELYFNYAREKFPETLIFRPLLWTNGPAPGLLYHPRDGDVLVSDGGRHNWLSHKQKDVPEAFDRQIVADKAQGYDYVGYHNYAKRRYSELVGEDREYLCKSAPLPRNSSCSWRGFEAMEAQAAVKNEGGESGTARNVTDYFQGCACYMASH